MSSTTQYVRMDLVDNGSLGSVIEYIKNNRNNFLSWKNYINYLLESNGGKYTRFADKIGFSKNTVKKWCVEGKKPQNRDSFIKIAFGLNMNLEQTNHLLKKYGSYSQLYPKDLYDAVIIYVIQKRQGSFDDPNYSFDSIKKWNEKLADIRAEVRKKYKENQLKLLNGKTLSTVIAHQNIASLKDDSDFERYILDNRNIFFNSYNKLVRFIDDFIKIRADEYNQIHDKDEEPFSLHALVKKKGLGDSLEVALSQLRTKRILPKRGQLITIGVLLNMVEQDINTMLELANMQKLYPRDQLDAMMIVMLTNAVEENPDLELKNAMSYIQGGSNLKLREQYRSEVERFYSCDFGCFNDNLDDIFDYIRGCFNDNLDDIFDYIREQVENTGEIEDLLMT